VPGKVRIISLWETRQESVFLSGKEWAKGPALDAEHERGKLSQGNRAKQSWVKRTSKVGKKQLDEKEGKDELALLQG